MCAMMLKFLTRSGVYLFFFFKKKQNRTDRERRRDYARVAKQDISCPKYHGGDGPNSVESVYTFIRVYTEKCLEGYGMGWLVGCIYITQAHTRALSLRHSLRDVHGCCLRLGLSCRPFLDTFSGVAPPRQDRRTCG